MTGVAWGPPGPDEPQVEPNVHDFYDRFTVQGTVPCRFDGHTDAVGVFYAPDGCICQEDKVQALCAQHALKAQQNGVELRVLCWL